MSMLNEAMRKKAREGDRKRGSIPPGLRSPSSGSQKKTRRYIVALAVVAAGILGGLAAIDYFYLKAPPADIVVAHPRDPLPPAAPAPPAAPPSAPPETVVPSAPPETVAESAGGRQGETKTLEPHTEVTALVQPKPTVAAVPAVVPRSRVSAPVKSALQKTPHRRVTTAADSRTAEMFLQKGLSYHRQGRYAEAIRMYRDALARDPGHTGAVINLAAAYIAVSDFARAIPVLDTAGALAPDNPQVLINRAIAEIGLGQPERALAHIDMAEKMNGAPPWEIAFHRSVALSRLGRFDEAIAGYRKAEMLQPNDPRLLFNIALVYDSLADFPTAVKYYTRFLEHGAVSSDETTAVQARIRELTAFIAVQAR